MGLMETIDLIHGSSIYIDPTREYYRQTNNFIKNNIYKDGEYKPLDIEISQNLKNEMENIINSGDYPEELKPSMQKLYEYTDIENLMLCAYNLKNVKVNRSSKYKIGILDFILGWKENDKITGEYDPSENLIEYYYKTTLPHELLHMASTNNIKFDDGIYYSGFRYSVGEMTFGRGLNEGYTELLTRRIFHDEDYDSDTVYKLNVYLLRMFELLYDDYKEMEKDYLCANYQSPIGNFVKYGSIDEFFTLANYLDYFAFSKMRDGEDTKAFVLLKRAVKRACESKYNEALQIEDEYYESEDKSLKKLFSFNKKTP